MADVVMPQMGESIAEGTIVRWIKNVGDKVERDEPLFEISTDKVDAEIPSPMAGVLTEIRHKEGETVPVNSVVGVIGPAGAKTAAPPPETPAAPPPPPKEQGDGSSAPMSATPPPAQQPKTPPAQPESPVEKPAAGAQSSEEALRQRSSPLVRRIAKEHNVDISAIRGTGMAGRVTKDDILGFIARGVGSGAVRRKARPRVPRRRRARTPDALRRRRSLRPRSRDRACRCRSCARRSRST